MKASQWIEVAAVTAAFFCALVFLAQPFLPKVDTAPMKVIELAIGAFAAIATAAAAVIALWFGLSTQRTQAAQARATADVVASRVVMKLTLPRAALKSLLEHWPSAADVEAKRSLLNALALKLSKVPVDIEKHDMIDLLPIGRQWPPRLAVALEALAGIQTFNGRNDHTWGGFSAEQRANEVAMAEELMRFTSEELELVGTHFRAAASTAAGWSKPLQAG